MATTKKFAVAGVSTFNGRTKLRFANDIMRIKILAKNGHSDLELINLPYEMSKLEIAQHLKEVGFKSDSVDVQAAIRYIIKKNTVKTQPQEAAVQVDSVTV